MQKNKFIEICLRQALQEGAGVADSLKKISPREIELVIDNLWADMLFLLLKDSQSIDFFCKTYNDVDIDYSSTSNEYTVTIPTTVVQLPQNLGIHLVRGKGSNHKFYPASNEDIDLYSGGDVEKYYDRTLYVLDGNARIKLVNFDYSSHNIRKVQLKLIPAFITYGWSEEVPIPSGRITEFTNMVAKALFQQKRFIDTSADGVPT